MNKIVFVLLVSMLKLAEVHYHYHYGNEHKQSPIIWKVVP